MKALVALLIALLPIALRAEYNPGSCWIRDVARVGEDTVWMLCEEGVIYRTSDGGATWSSVRVGEVTAYALAVPDAKRAFVVGAAGALLASRDAGGTWRRIESGTNRRLVDIFFVGDSGWAVGNDGIIVHSEDGGRSWQPQESFTRSNLEAVYFVDERTGWAVGWNGTILRTTDGGELWEIANSERIPYALTAVYFRDANEGWAVGIPSTIIRTRDGGLTWIRQESPEGGWMGSIGFTEDGRGFIAGDRVLVSDDGGESWSLLPVDLTETARDVLVRGEWLWVVGHCGVVLSTDGGISWARRFELPPEEV
jgi:photosystem II stability/assembly factor-like uncharacterized protein